MVVFLNFPDTLRLVRWKRPGVLKNNDIKTAYSAVQVHTCILKMNQTLEPLLKFNWH